jgi:hypothetical protein
MLGPKCQNFVDRFCSFKEYWLICWNDLEIRNSPKRSWIEKRQWIEDNQ